MANLNTIIFPAEQLRSGVPLLHCQAQERQFRWMSLIRQFKQHFWPVKRGPSKGLRQFFCNTLFRQISSVKNHPSFSISRIFATQNTCIKFHLSREGILTEKIRRSHTHGRKTDGPHLEKLNPTDADWVS